MLFSVFQRLWTDVARCGGSLHDIHNTIPLLDGRIDKIQVPSSI